MRALSRATAAVAGAVALLGTADAAATAVNLPCGKVTTVPATVSERSR